MGKFQLFPDQASTLAPQVDHLYFYLCTVTVFFTALIAVLVMAFAVVFRRQHDDERPAETHTHKILEIAWVVIPFVLVMVMFGWGAAIFVSYNRPPANAMEIDVVGKQWMWKIQHPDGQREINELHVPIGKPVKLIMTSQDVIHNFGIPAFRVKMDVVPGHYSSEWFEATRIGTYDIFCDQYCGTQHSRMVGKVVVMPQADYQAWLAGERKDVSPFKAGYELFQQYSCVKCHSQQAPTLAHLYGTKVNVWQDGKLITVNADEDYIRDSIEYPDHQIVDGYRAGAMPSFKGRLSEEQLMQLIAYIKLLGGDVPTDQLKMMNSYVPTEQVEPETPGNAK